MRQPISVENNLELGEEILEGSSPLATEYFRPASASLPRWEWLKVVRADFQIIFERDPRATNWLEVLLFYPGLHAIALHRIAHWLALKGVPFIPRAVSHLGRWLTGIEIHPGALVGRGVFIDRGTGVVIGETAIVSDYCQIQQNVTLGGTGKESGKRHPTLGKHAIVGAGALILGNINIGDRVNIIAGSVVLQDVPDDSTVWGVPARIIPPRENCVFKHGKIPEIESKSIQNLFARLDRIEQNLKKLQSNTLP